MQIEGHRRFEHCLKQCDRLFHKSITTETIRDQRIVMGPDTSIMISDRIVAGFAFGNGSNTPARERCLRHQRLTHKTSVLRGCNSGDQALARVGSKNMTWALLSIKRQRETRNLRTPERTIEVLVEARCAVVKERRFFLETYLPRQCRGCLPGAVHVSLHFAQRHRAGDFRSVRMEDRVVGVFPTLVNQTGRSLPSVFDEAIAVFVAELLNPTDRG